MSVRTHWWNFFTYVYNVKQTVQISLEQCTYVRTYGTCIQEYIHTKLGVKRWEIIKRMYDYLGESTNTQTYI